MFKIGDKVIYIGKNKYKSKPSLIPNKTYTVIGIFDTTKITIYQHDFIYIKGYNFGYDINLFLSLKEYRKKKLNNLNLCSK